jgi:hypothetical protein
VGKCYQYGDELLDFMKDGKLLDGIVKSVHRKELSSIEENVRTLRVWRVPYCLANLAEETHVLAKTAVSVSASFTVH